MGDVELQAIAVCVTHRLLLHLSIRSIRVPCLDDSIVILRLTDGHLWPNNVANRAGLVPHLLFLRCYLGLQVSQLLVEVLLLCQLFVSILLCLLLGRDLALDGIDLLGELVRCKFCGCPVLVESEDLREEVKREQLCELAW